MNPDAARPGEFGRGWPVLAGAMFGVGAGVSGLLLYTAGLFVPDLEREIGLTRTQFGLAIFAVSIALAVTNPLVGMAIDRFGVRLPAALGLVALAAGFLALSLFVVSVPTYVALLALTAAAASASGPIAFTKAVSAWFVRHRGMALGITMTGIGLSAAVAPPLLARLIDTAGWQQGYRALALVSLFGLLPLLLLVRLPRAGPARAAGRNQDMAFDHRTFRIMLAAFFAMALGFAGLIPHFVPLLVDSGSYSPPQAGALAGLIGLSVIVSRLVVGWLVDRVPAPLVASGLCLLCASGCLLLLVVGSGAAPVAALAIGAAMGGEIDLIAFLVARHFALDLFGRTYGLQYAAFILGSGLSPLWMGAARDRAGDYDLALGGGAAVIGLAALLFLMLPGGERQTT